MNKLILDESADATPAKTEKAENPGRKVAMIAVAVVVIGVAIWLICRSLSEPSGTRPMDDQTAAAVPPPPSPTSATKPATAPQEPGSGSRRAAPGK